MMLISFLHSFLYYYFKMGKNTKKSAAGRKPKETYPCLNASTLRDKLKTKYINK